MIKWFFSGFLLILYSVATAQLQSVSKTLINDLPVYQAYHPNLKMKSAQAPKSCDEDTLEYARYKGTAYTGIGIFNGYALGQYFDTPDSVEITGTTFYCWGLSSGNDTVELTVKLYKAGSDTLPTGSALRTTTIKIDTAFGGGVLTALRRSVVFPTSYKTNEPFIITIESSDSLRVAIVTNSYTAKDGDAENLACGTVSGTWYNCLNLNINGTPLDCDVLIEPHVKYKTFADFSVDNCFRITDSVAFTNKSSKILGHRMYNRYMSYGLGQYAYYWYFGLGAGSIYDPAPKYKYFTNNNYQVRLVTTMYGWRSPIGCGDTAYFDLHYQPTEITYLADTPVCSGNAAVINAFSTGNISWFNSVSDTTAFLKSSTYTTPVLDSTMIYVVQAKNFECETQKKTILIPVATTPDLPTVFNDSICLNAKANLSASSNVGQIIWWTDSVKGVALDTGNVYVTPSLTSSKLYYAETNNFGCLSSKRVEVVADVNSNNAPSDPITNTDSLICLYDGNAILTAASPDGDDLRWYTNPTGGTAVSTSGSYSFTPTTLGNKFIYVEAYDGQCASTRVQKKITVWTFPTHSFMETDTLCLGDTLNLDFSYTFGAVKWFDAASGGNVVYDSNKFKISDLSKATTFYLEPYSNACKDTMRHPLEIEVLPFGKLTQLQASSVCANNPATLTANTNVGYIIWSSSAIMDTILAQSNLYVTQPLKATSTFYAATKNYKCISVPEPITVTVKPAPSADFNYQVNSTGNFTFVASSPGLSYNWNFGDGNTGIGRSLTYKYTSNGNFDVTLSTTNGQGCSASSKRSVKVAGITGSVSNHVANFNVNVWPNPTNGFLFLELNSSQCNASLVSIDGKLLNNWQLYNGFNTIDLNEATQATGTYILKISNKESTQYFRIIKQ